MRGGRKKFAWDTYTETRTHARMEKQELPNSFLLKKEIWRESIIIYGKHRYDSPSIYMLLTWEYLEMSYVHYTLKVGLSVLSTTRTVGIFRLVPIL
jgi:hypothetical protein